MKKEAYRIISETLQSLSIAAPTDAQLSGYLRSGRVLEIARAECSVPIGFVGWSTTPNALIIYGLFVHADYQGHGHGARLLTMLESKANGRSVVVSISHDAEYLSSAIEWLADRGYRLDRSTVGASRLELRQYRTQATRNRLEQFLSAQGCQ